MKRRMWLSMPSWITTAYDATETFYINHQFLFFVVSILITPVFLFFRRIIKTASTGKLESLEGELTRLKQYEEGSIDRPLGATFELFLLVTNAVIVACLLYAIFSSLTPRRAPTINGFINILSIYGPIITALGMRVTRILRPQRRIAKVQARIQAIKSGQG